MKLLILGGTVFVGRAIVEAALTRGDDITLFTRGRHGADLFPQVERLRGDREVDLAPLAGRRWDAVIDTCGFTPEVVGASARLLAGAVDRYLFVSSCSVYLDWPAAPGLDETARLREIGDDYGVLKARSELAAEAAMPGRVVQARAGTIVGPYENIGRLPWWLARAARGGAMLAPGRPDAPVQVIDVRDLADWLLRAAERRESGAFNLAGPPPPAAPTMRELLDACVAATDSDARLTWVDDARLLAHGVVPWSGLPLWVPERAGTRGMAHKRIDRALATGLRHRPIADTVRDTWAWMAAGGQLGDYRAELRPPGIAPELESEILADD